MGAKASRGCLGSMSIDEGKAERRAAAPCQQVPTILPVFQPHFPTINTVAAPKPLHHFLLDGYKTCGDAAVDARSEKGTEDVVPTHTHTHNFCVRHRCSEAEQP